MHARTHAIHTLYTYRLYPLIMLLAQQKNKSARDFKCSACFRKVRRRIERPSVEDWMENWSEPGRYSWSASWATVDTVNMAMCPWWPIKDSAPHRPLKRKEVENAVLLEQKQRRPAGLSRKEQEWNVTWLGNSRLYFLKFKNIEWKASDRKLFLLLMWSQIFDLNKVSQYWLMNKVDTPCLTRLMAGSSLVRNTLTNGMCVCVCEGGGSLRCQKAFSENAQIASWQMRPRVQISD